MERVVKRRETVDIVGDLVSMIDTSIVFKSITDNLDGTYTIETCDTSYAFPCLKFEHDGVEYEVLETGFLPNNQIVLKGDSVPVGPIVLEPMNYYHGTVIAGTTEIECKFESMKRYPMVYLMEVIRDRFFNLEENIVDRESSFKLFFLLRTNENDWCTDEHYDRAIKPMRNMLYKFIDVLNNNENIGEIDSYSAINRAKFGVYSTDSGHTKRVFTDQTSGVELGIDLPILKGSLCVDCC